LKDIEPAGPGKITMQISYLTYVFNPAEITTHFSSLDFLKYSSSNK